ncbi:Hg(II)-responsive transcriptional regulator [Methylocaldum sp. BRCS4]|jgi:MerR family mercuric resistance operon transcriptional regulator|uniref:Hg(II)-responsive transcriptional regulator n=1 Tax=Methylocaldum sp. 14B TaxID=1912213 RepID=UPI00098AD862|nr:Hg(II)-responsive transcriptional regulator [Methylocaldum sp. 14B]MVF23087.1 Hg(II)-responsive transcriptional regulator [Methylocaldum sp. BRCS4]
MSEQPMTIGRLAQAASVNVETIRYYQRIGLIPTPKKAYGSFRRYPRDSLMRLRFIKRAQQLGFTLDEVALLLKLSDGTHCEETRELAERKLAVVDRKLADLTAIHDVLGELIAACRRGSPAAGCSIIESLTRNGNADESEAEPTANQATPD